MEDSKVLLQIMNITLSSVQELKLTNITWAITNLTIDITSVGREFESHMVH